MFHINDCTNHDELKANFQRSDGSLSLLTELFQCDAGAECT